MKETDDFAALLEEFEGQAPKTRGPREGEMVTGTVVAIGEDSIFVDCGAKSEGVLDREQLSNRDGELQVKVGDTVEARVVDNGSRSGTLILRTSIAKGAQAVAELEQAYSMKMPVEGIVEGTNKGGVEVKIAGVRAFCPFSQLADHFVENADDFIGQRLQFRITKFEGGKRPNVVVSRRVLLEEENAKLAEELMKTLAVGVVTKGRVKSLKPYGAFVDIGGMEGMLHVSEIGFSRVSDPSEVLSVGQELEVQVLKLERTDDARRPYKVSLSLKAMADDPWLNSAARYPEGSKVKGTIVRLEKFGAFVEVETGIEGLVHIGELGAPRRINHPREVVSMGQAVEVRVVSVDPIARRLSLSMKEGGDADDGPKSFKDEGQNLGTFADLLKGKLS